MTYIHNIILFSCTKITDVAVQTLGQHVAAKLSTLQYLGLSFEGYVLKLVFITFYYLGVTRSQMWQ